MDLPPKYNGYSFASFITNSQNERAYKFCNDYSQNPKGFLFLYGKAGVGKTHLAVSILKNFLPVEISDRQKYLLKNSLINEIEYYKKHQASEIQNNYQLIKNYFNKGAWQFRNASSIFLKSIQFALKLHELSLKDDESRIMFIKNILRYDCILLDDFGSEKFSDSVRQNFYYLIDECYTNEKPLIITSNESIMEINQKEPRIASRLAEGLIINLQGNDFRLKKITSP